MAFISIDTSPANTGLPVASSLDLSRANFAPGTPRGIGMNVIAWSVVSVACPSVSAVEGGELLRRIGRLEQRHAI